MKTNPSHEEATMHTVTVLTHLSASTDEVWSKIGDPGTISSWHPAIAKSSLEGKDRKCTLANGAQIDEKIDNIDDAKRSYSYRIVESPCRSRTTAPRSRSWKLMAAAPWSGPRASTCPPGRPRTRSR